MSSTVDRRSRRTARGRALTSHGSPVLHNVDESRCANRTVRDEIGDAVDGVERPEFDVLYKTPTTSMTDSEQRTAGVVQ